MEIVQIAARGIGAHDGDATGGYPPYVVHVAICVLTLCEWCLRSPKLKLITLRMRR